MNWRSTYTQFLSLPIPALLGFLMTYNISQWIDRYEGWLKRSLAYIGEHTLYIFIFHICAYKVVSLLKIWYYGLDIRQIGCHMVIHEYSQQDWFWMAYTIAGVGIPLALYWLQEQISNKICCSGSVIPFSRNRAASFSRMNSGPHPESFRKRWKQSAASSTCPLNHNE